MSWRIAPAATATHDLVDLQSLVERIFGAGDRGAGWFARKLDRECVDPTLSHIALRGDEPRDPTSWLGYILVGRPASRWPVARTAGTGVVPAWRGRGIASALLAAASTSSTAAGAEAIELLADRRLEAFYAARGFVLEQRVTSLLAFARGAGRTPLPSPAPWDALDGVELQRYLAEAWTRTPEAQRHTLGFDAPRAVIHVCRENRAFALHRTLVAHTDDAPRVFDHVLERLPRAAPVIAIAMPEVSSITASLRDAGWLDSQRASLLRRAGHRSHPA